MRRKWEIGRGRPERGGMQGLLDRVGGSGGYGGSKKTPEGLLSASKKVKPKKKIDPDDVYEGKPAPHRVIENILEEHGFRLSESKSPNTYFIEAGGKFGRDFKVRLFEPNPNKISVIGGKTKIQQSTLNNPSITDLKIWLGY